MASESEEERAMAGVVPKEDNQDIFVNRRSVSLLGSITRKVNNIEPLLLDKRNLLLVEEDYQELVKRIEAFKTNIEKESNHPDLDEKAQLKIMDWYYEKSRVFLEAKRRISDWIDETNDLVIQPADSVSQAGSQRSRTSGMSNARSEARIRLVESQAKLEAEQKLDEDLRRIQEARLKIEKSALEEKERLDQLERKARVESEKRRIMDITAKLNQFDEMDRLQEWNQDSRDVKPHSLNSASDQVELLAEIALRSHLPKSEPEVFDGTDLTRFTSFMQAFDRLIACNTKSFSDLLYYLEKYTKDEPRELVRSCFHMDPKGGYEEARQLLKKEYGNEFQVANAFLQKIQKWSSIKSDDVTGLKKLSVFLRGCENYLKTVSGMNQLNSPSQIQDVILKLPLKLRERWRNRAFYLLENKGSVEFKDLADFIHLQASIASIPIFGDITEPGQKQTRTSQSFSTNRSTSLATNTEIDNRPKENVSTASSARESCPHCKKTNHRISECFRFSKMEHVEKIDRLKELGLCFGCLGQGHVSRSCSKRLKCRECERNHPSCLHRADREQNIHDFSKSSEPLRDQSQKNSTSACCLDKSTVPCQTGAGTNPKVALALIPVKVKVKGQEKSVITYAGLDNFATDCFVQDNILEELGISGDKVEIGLTTMTSTNEQVTTRAIHDLEILDLDENERICLPTTYARKKLPVSNSDLVTEEDLKKWPHLSSIPFCIIRADVGLMIGANAPEAIKPLKIVSGPPLGPYASKHRLGWALNGPLTKERVGGMVQSNRIRVDHEDIDTKIRHMYNADFADSEKDSLGPSIEDTEWLKKVKSSIRVDEEGHYEIALPFRDIDPKLPNNRKQAIQRLASIGRRIERDPKFKDDYCTFMQTMFDKNFAEPVSSDELETRNGQVWYIIHHAVYHKKKKTIRIVFNCSAKFMGISLNDALLPGPDLVNNLLGVLIRFRERKIAVMADIEKMFYQVKVPAKDYNFLRFLWYPNGDTTKPPVEYCLKVHVFGAVSSPSCASFALRQAALDHETKVSPKSIRTIQEGFYVDDLVVSVDEVADAITLLQEARFVCHQARFNLTQIASNSREVLSAFNVEDLAKNFHLNLHHEELPVERALGIAWDAESDMLGFKMNHQDQPQTRRGLLSTTYAIYDPFGHLGPITMPPKRLLQELCARNCGWDEEIPDDLREVWMRWTSELSLLSNYSIPRWIQVSEGVNSVQIHVFSDGSEVGYAAVAYVRVVKCDAIRTTLLFAKSRLAPLKRMSVPRLELAGAKLAIEVATILRRERSYGPVEEYFWTDSETVLKYLQNKKRRFHRFVANRVAFIRERSDVDRWNHVPGLLNPADVASRGLPIRDFVKNVLWKSGPEFLWEPSVPWPGSFNVPPLDDDDPEIVKDKIISAAAQVDSTSLILDWFESISDWDRLRRMVVGFIRVKTKLMNQLRSQDLSGDLFVKADQMIIKQVQNSNLEQDMNDIKVRRVLKRNSPLRKLSPFIDDDGILRVGGRLNLAKDLNFDQKHPVVVPKGHVAMLLAKDAHVRVGHLGKESVLAELRKRYWVIGAQVMVKKMLRDCIHCKKYQERCIEQYMADLPEDRLCPDQPPFTNTGVDMFGPFPVVRGRSTVERFGIVFTCLTSRAIHLEVVFEKSTDSFIQSLRRFIARRGQVRIMRSDNGTNFVGAEREIREILEKLEQEDIREELRKMQVTWIFNPPYAHHFGGVWEREIRTLRQVLTGVMGQQPKSFSDESLCTYLCEVEAILNSRPLTPVSDDPTDLEAITPNHLLLLKSGPTLPPGLFQKTDLYARRRWKQVQYLSDLFWSRWRREYLFQLQKRQRWTKPRRNTKVGDLVLMVQENVPRNRWPLARVIELFPSKDGIVRQVKVKSASGSYKRPVSQLILLQEKGEESSSEELKKESNYEY